MKRESEVEFLLQHNRLLNIFIIFFISLLLTGCTNYQLPANAGQMIINLSQSLGSMWKLVTAGAYLCGVAFTAIGVFHLKAYGELRTMMATQTNIKRPITLFIVAGVFMYLPEAAHVLMMSSFGYSSPLSPIGYTGPSFAGLSQQAMVAMVAVVQFVGLIAFVRGWYIIAKSTQPGSQSTMGKGFTHIIGGLLAINIVGTQQVISLTLGS